MTEPATAAAQPDTPADTPPDPVQLLQSRSYLAILLLGAIVGLPIATVAYFFLKIVDEAQQYVFTTLPNDLGFSGEPVWWPLLPLTLSGLIVALIIRYLPGIGGHKPAEGLKTGGPVQPIELPGIILAALATLCLGAVLGPEAPLIAMGSGLGVLAVHLLKKDAPARATLVIGAAGSFAAVSALLGSPLVAAFLMLEVTGLGGPLLGVVLVPGLLAAGIGSLVFVGLDRWTGFGTFSLAVPNIPAFTTPTIAEFLVGHRHRPHRRGDRGGHQAAGAVPPTHRRAPHGAAHPAGRTGGRRLGHGVRATVGQELVVRALLRTIGPAHPHRRRRQLVGRRAGAARGVQGPRLLPRR